MRVLRDEFFIRKDFAFYDCGIAAVVSLSLIHTYDLIRRFTFRADATDPILAKLKVQGYVVASIGQSKLASLAGVSRQTMNEHIAKLKKLGWVDVHKHKDKNHSAYYVLGQMVSDSKHKQHEVFFADAWMNELWEFLQDRMTEEFGKSFDFKDTEVEWRIDLVRQFIRSEEDSEQNGGCPPQTTEQNVACRPNPTGVVGLTRQPTSAQPDTEVENSEVENLEVDNGEGLAALAPSAPETADGRAEENGGRGASPDNQIPRDVGEHTTLSESGEYPSVPPPPPGPNPKWMVEQEQEAVGNGISRGRVHVDRGSTIPSPPPVALRGQIDQATLDKYTAEGKKRAEAQMQKAKAKEAKMEALGGKPVPVTRRKQLQTLEKTWCSLMEDKFQGVRIAPWEGRERGQVWNLVEKYSGEIVQEALSYLVERWDEIRTRMLKGRGGVPSVGFLLRFHDVLVVESQLWTEYRRVKKQVDDYYGGDVFKPDPPEPLNSQYKKLRKEMADLGLPV
jgi:biotin operon repressor